MTTVTVPAHVAEICLAGADPELRAAAEGSGVLVGDRVEIDLRRFAGEASPAAAADLLAYFEDCRRFWGDVAAARPAGEFVAVRRRLAGFVQRNTKTLKADLVDQLDAFSELPGFDSLLDAVTGAEVDWDAAVAACPGAAVVSQDGSDSVVRIVTEAAVAWPAALGGASWPCEVRRVFTLRVSHAKWRDRRQRRLVEVVVDVDEIWPAPPRGR